MPIEHKHTCPKCFEHKMCRMDCTIEPDLGLTAQGWPRGARMNCEDCGPDDPRPADMAELARLTTIELQKLRPAWWQGGAEVWVIRLRGPAPNPSIQRFCHSLFGAKFDNLGPIGCANVIQAEEAKKAAEWADDI